MKRIQISSNLSDKRVISVVWIDNNSNSKIVKNLYPYETHSKNLSYIDFFFFFPEQYLLYRLLWLIPTRYVTNAGER